MPKRIIRTDNIFTLTTYRLMLVLLLFTLCRIIFLAFNYSYFNDLSAVETLMIFCFGLRFDLSAILIINLPYIFFSFIPFRNRVKKYYLASLYYFFVIINSLAIGINLVDVIYFRFTFKRTTADIFKYLGTGDDFAALIPDFIRDFWYMIVLWIALIFFLIFLVRFVRFHNGKNIINKLKYYTTHAVLFVIVIFFTIIGIRGGFQLRPLSIMVAGKYADAKNVPLVLNTTYTLITTFNKEGLKLKKYYDPEMLDSIYTPVHNAYDQNPFTEKNIIIIIFESLTTEHIGALNTGLDNGNYKGYTPFLDSLIKKSLVFRGFSNGKRSIEGIPAILSGLPSLMDNAFITSQYGGNNIQSLAYLLKPKSYYSAFFHGGNNGTMGFDNYSKISGFDKYYGRNEYNNDADYDGKWGIFDEEFLQFALKVMNSFPTPFISAIMTLSSHHPFTIPDKYRNRFVKGKLRIHESIQYTDYSLRKFFEAASGSSWYDNSLFVITADHTSEAYYPYYRGGLGMFEIPIIIYDPDSNFNLISRKIAQQTDILPSLLDYINYENEFVAFGESVFDTNATRFSVNYLNNNFQLVKGGYLFRYNGEIPTELYDIEQDSLLLNNIVNLKVEIAREMELFIKAYIQQYNNRMIENRLTVK